MLINLLAFGGIVFGTINYYETSNKDMMKQNTRPPKADALFQFAATKYLTNGLGRISLFSLCVFVLQKQIIFFWKVNCVSVKLFYCRLTSTLCISDPYNRSVYRRVGRGVRWVRTHPPPTGRKRSAWKDPKMNLQKKRTPKDESFLLICQRT